MQLFRKWWNLSCTHHVVAFIIALCVHLSALLNPMHVSDKQGLLWMTIRIRLVVVNAVLAAHVKVMELWLLLWLVIFWHLYFANFLTVIVVIIIRMRFIFHHVIVNVLNVLLREGVGLEGLSYQWVVVGAELTHGWVSFGQML